LIRAGKQGQRKIAPHLVKRWHEGAEHGGSTKVGAQPEAPDWSSQECLLPLFFKDRLRCRDAALEPGLPDVEEIARGSQGNEIALGWKLAIEVALHRILTAKVDI